VSATADGLVVEDCDFYDGALAKELVLGISIAAACHEVTIRNCRFIVNDGDGGGCEAAIKAAGATDYTRVEGNFIQGNFTGKPIDLSGAASVGLIVANNSVFNTDTAAGLGINLHASSTGHVVRNLVTNAKDTIGPVVAAAAHVAENYGSNAAGASGIIKPTVDS
jgi:nitrous oxidase accessory protein NosD